MNVRYRVTLETSERVQLVAMVLGGKGAYRRLKRAQILLADVVDRAALEHARVAELHIADERSRRVNHLLIDVAAVLTPQQRTVLRTEMAD